MLCTVSVSPMVLIKNADLPCGFCIALRLLLCYHQVSSKNLRQNEGLEKLRFDAALHGM